jgi:hypothetical protein
MEAALSLERFARYVAWANGDRDQALALYTLNTRVSEAFYIALQTLEISLRNRVNGVMSTLHGERWFDDSAVILIDHQRAQAADAIADLEEEGKEPTAGRVIAALSFSFWTTMFSPAYEPLWRSTLHQIASREGRGLNRKDFSRPLTQVRVLRNRIAHHEPILHWDLRRHHRAVMDLTQWLSPPAFSWSEPIDRFEKVYPMGGVILARNLAKD